MSIQNYYWFSGGLITLFTAILHTIGGEISLVRPMLNSSVEMQVKTELLGVWHLITVLLFAAAYVVLKNCRIQKSIPGTLVIQYIGYLFLLFAGVFIVVSFYQMTFAPQWILFIPMGLLLLIGARK